MTNLRLSWIIDFFIRNALIFILIYAWAIFYLQDWVISLIIAAAAAFFVSLFLDKIKNKRINQKRLTAKEKEHVEACTLQLLLASDAERKDYFYKLLSLTHEVKKEGKLLTYISGGEKTLFYPAFNDKTLCLYDLSASLAAAKQKDCKALVLTGISCPPELLKLASAVESVEVTVLDITQLYALNMKPHNSYPPELIKTKGATKLTLKDLFRYAFSGKRTKSYVWLGLILILTSFFVIFKLYYLIMGSVLLVFALISLIISYRTKSKLAL